MCFCESQRASVGRTLDSMWVGVTKQVFVTCENRFHENRRGSYFSNGVDTDNQSSGMFGNHRLDWIEPDIVAK